MQNKKHKIIGSMIVIVIASLLALHMFYKYQRAPKLNPHPKYFVTISGNIQPHMPYPQTLMFRATYAAYNPKCSIWISYLEGVPGMPGHPVYYPVHPNTKGDYKVKIPIDAYKPGMCDWKAMRVMSATISKLPPKKAWTKALSFGDLINFGRIKDNNELPGLPSFSKGTLYCGKGGIESCTGSELASDYSKFDVLRDKSYHFMQNIQNKKD